MVALAQKGVADTVRCSSCKGELRATVSFCPFCGEFVLARAGVAASAAPSVRPLPSRAVKPSEPEVVVEAPAPSGGRARPEASVPSVAPTPLVSSGQVHGRGEAGAAPSLRADARLAAGSGDSGARRRNERPRWVLPALAFAVAALAVLARYGLTPRSVPVDLAAKDKPVVAQPQPSKLPPSKPPAAPVIEDVRGSFDLTSQWATVALKRDPQRPHVFLYASAPFRLRSDGHLYVVTGGAPVALDLGSLASIEARAVAGRLRLTVVSSAHAGERK